MTTLSHALLTDYADAFHTYGSLSNPVWFLGLEEGGGRSLDEATRKLSSWDQQGRRLEIGLNDSSLKADHADSPFLRTGNKPAKLQITWANQLRVLLGMRDERMSNDRVRYLQTREHGTLDGPTCLMELFPLPCRNAGAWVYGEVAYASAMNKPNVFATKRAYVDHYLPKRLKTIAALVKEHRPAALVCTSWSYRHPILEMLENHETPKLGIEGSKREARIGRLHDTIVAVCSHPAQQIGGPRNAFYHALGRAISERFDPGVDLKLVA